MTDLGAIFKITNKDDLVTSRQKIEALSQKTLEKIYQLKEKKPLESLAIMKFGQIGSHPLEDRSLNLIEQLNQTFTYLVAIKAAELLLELHPECEGLKLAPGAHAPKGSLDIESYKSNFIGAETFAAVTPSNNNKLNNDLKKLKDRQEAHKYVFFASPKFPETARLHKLEKFGVKVWSVKVDGMEAL